MNAATKTPTREEYVVRDLIDQRAKNEPDKVFAIFADEEEWTYADLRRQTLEAASGLQKLGVKQGDYVLAWLPNRPAAVRTTLAINYLGAICVPLNLSYRGNVLAHAINMSAANIMVADQAQIDRLAGLELPHLKTLIVVGNTDEKTAIAHQITETEMLALATGEPTPPAKPIEPWDTQCILFTSGTTGNSKGVLSSYIHRYAHAVAVPGVNANERRLIHSSLSHAGGFGAIYGMLAVGGSIAMLESFKTPTFWSDVKRLKATNASLLGATLPFLLQRPPSDEDKNHALTVVRVAPVNETTIAFSKRFGVDICGVYSLTETAIPLLCGPKLDRAGQCGLPQPGFELRIVDENDFEVPDGQAGELIMRAANPWINSHGYLNNPEATAKSLRNGWFHSGDIFRRDPDGQYVFLDRLNDAIRRRGENISAFEVENEIAQFADVSEVAVVGVPSEFGEDEVLAVIKPLQGTQIDCAALIEYLRPKLAHFMIPRYIRIVDDLPKTSTQKVMKQSLRDAGVTNDTWDRSAHGIEVKSTTRT